MSNFEEQTRSERPTLTWEGRTLGQEIDTLFKDLDITQESLMNGDRLAITIVGQSGDKISTVNFEAHRDPELGGEVVANVLGSEFEEQDPSQATKLFDQLAGGLWEWPEVKEHEAESKAGE